MIEGMSKFSRLAEFFGLYILLPGLVCLIPQLPALPVLWLVALACGRWLWKDPSFDRSRLWHSAALNRTVKFFVLHFAIGALSLSLLTVAIDPDLLFSLPRQETALWLLVVTFYPLLSAYPQEVVYRAFFFHRYGNLLPNRGWMVLINAMLFGYMHIIFRSPLAMALTVVGGWLFADAYLRYRSLLPTTIIHSIYGWLIFTLGLGGYFHRGSLALFGFG